MIQTLRESLTAARQAAKLNLLPGLLLQGILAVFLIAYLTHDGTRNLLANVAQLKQESGLVFTFISYLLAGGLLPELLRIAFFQKFRVTKDNLWRFFTSGIIWGCMGLLVDFFYRYQASWFGSGNDFQTVALKLFVDQFI